MAMTEEAFYTEVDKDRFASSAHTAGPWTDQAQHMGPPSALLVRALQSCESEQYAMLARVTVEILGPVPLTDLTVTANVVRPGRSVELLTARLATDERVVASASAWRIVRSNSAEVAAGTADPLPPPESATPMPARPPGWGPGYLDAMEWRTLAGALGESGPATMWVRQRIPLVAGEQPTELQRLVTVADSGNGMSGWLDPTRWWFINTELTVHTFREPVGEWIGVDANTTIGPNGVGVARSTLFDTSGQVGDGAQALLVRRR